MGILYTFTCGLFGIGWVIDVLKSISFKETTLNIEEPTLSIEPTPSIQSESYKNRFEEYEERSTISHKYFSGLDEIESMWSVMYNLCLLYTSSCSRNISRSPFFTLRKVLFFYHNICCIDFLPFPVCVAPGLDPATDDYL